MNQEKLSYLSAHTGDIDAHDAQQLEELTRSYPYFPAPWILLARHYKKTGDLRFESTLHNTALRVNDRKWLHDFIEGNITTQEPAEQTTVSSVLELEEQASLITEATAVEENHPEFSSSEDLTTNTPETEISEINIDKNDESFEDSAMMEVSEQSVANIETKNVVTENSLGSTKEPELSFEPEQPVAEIEIPDNTTIEDAEIATPISESIADTIENASTEPFEFPNETEHHQENEQQEAKEFEIDSGIIIEIDREAVVEMNNGEAVFEEISEFDSGTGSIEAAVEADISSGLLLEPIMPDFTEFTANNTVDSTDISEDLNSPVESEKELDTNSLDSPAVTKTEETVSTAQPIIKVAVYNIEDYFRTEEDNAEPPSDFFSWLKKPKWHEENVEEESNTENAVVEHKLELIDKFLHSNPGISKPKTDFYKPAEAAKKSEIMPHELATETLAKVYIRQENWLGAVRIYEKLMLKFPEKSSYFADLIQKLKKEHHL